MTEDDLAALRQSLDPQWHELRERRVLEQALADRRVARRAPRRRGRVAMIATGCVAVAIAAGVLLALRANAPAPAELAASSAPHMRFADGSIAILSEGAEVQIGEQSATAVHLIQPQGSVRYQVVRNAARLFSIDAGGVQVTVIGTEFDVEHREGRVRVEVIHGRVRVSDGSRELELTAGETVHLVPAPAAPTPSASAGRALQPEPIEVATTPAPPVPAERAPRVSMRELERLADEARVAHRLDEAAALLEQMIESDARDPRAVTALFTLASIRSAQGRHALAAQHYARYRARAVGGTLDEDALAQEAIESDAAGARARGARLAAEYVERFPEGAHRARMHRLIGP